MCNFEYIIDMCPECRAEAELEFEETDHGDQLAIQMSASFDDELHESAKKLSRMSVPEVIERLNQAVNRRD